MDGINDYLLYGILPEKRDIKKIIPNTNTKSDFDEIIEDKKNEKEITVNYIIKKKPKAKIVREFLKQNLASIRSEEELMFDIEI